MLRGKWRKMFRRQRGGMAYANYPGASGGIWSPLSLGGRGPAYPAVTVRQSTLGSVVTVGGRAGVDGQALAIPTTLQIGPESGYWTEDRGWPGRLRIVAASGGDYTSFKEAVEGCDAGDVVWVMPGEHSVGATVTVPYDDIAIVGEGFGGAVLNFTAEDAAHCIDVNLKQRIVMRGFTIQAVAGKTGRGIQSVGHDTTLEHLRINGDGLDYVIRSSGTRLRLLNCWLQSIRGPWLTAGQQIVVGNVIEYTRDGGAYGLRVGAGDGGFFAYNEIHATGAAVDYCVYLHDCSWRQLVHNTIVIDNPDAGARIVWVNANVSSEIGNRVAGNIIVGDSEGLVGDGIRLESTNPYNLDYTQVVDNQVFYCDRAIRVDDARVRQSRLHDNQVNTCTTGISNAGSDTDDKDNT